VAGREENRKVIHLESGSIKILCRETEGLERSILNMRKTRNGMYSLETIKRKKVT
jgi:hypothetical protein